MHNATIVKTYKSEPAPLFMMGVVNEFLDLLYWRLNRILDRQRFSMLQWAIMQRAYDRPKGVPFRQIIEATGASKDNVCRAAHSLKGLATVQADPTDRRARIVVLTKTGRKRVGFLSISFQREMMKLLGAQDERSIRVRDFKTLLWDASAFLAPSELASDARVKRSEENLRLFPDTSLQYAQDPTLESIWIAEVSSDDDAPPY